MKRVAVIDIGSGSTTLAIFDLNNEGSWDRLDQQGKSLRLMEGLDASGRLVEGAVRGLLMTVEGYMRLAREDGVEHVEIVATSAMREAVNGPEIIAELGRIPGCTARIVSGEEEGRLAAHAVLCTLPLRDGVVLDLGGGSLQLVHVRDRRVVESLSLPLGALRLYDAFLLGNDPPTGDALVALRRHVLAQVGTVSWLRNRGGILIAAGGSARSIGKMHRRAAGTSRVPAHGFTIDIEAVTDAYERLSRLPRLERSAVPGLREHRADTIVAASLTLATVLRYGGFDAMYLSTYGIREGVAFRALFGEATLNIPANS